MVHLRVRNRFATDPDTEHVRERKPDKEELEAELAGDLQRVLAALRRSAYAPPLRLVPADTFRHHGETRAQSGEIESAHAGLADAVSNSAAELRAHRARERAGGKRIAVYALTAIAALFGGAVVFQQPLGLGGPIAEAQTLAKQAAARIIETAPVGLIIVFEVAADPLRGWAQDQHQLPEVADTSASGAHEPAGTPADPEISPAATNSVSAQTLAELSGLARSVDLRPTSIPSGAAPDQEAAQSSIPSPAELQAMSSPAMPDTSAVLSLRPSISVDDGPSLLSAEPSQELIAISQAVAVAPPLAPGEPTGTRPAITSDEAVPQASGKRPATAASLGQPISTTVNTAVNMRAGPDNEAPVVAVVPAGSRVTVTSCKFWCEVVFDGKRGWVYNEFVNLVGSPVRSEVAGPPKTVETRRRCEQERRGWGAAVARTIRQGFIADGSAKSGERC